MAVQKSNIDETLKEVMEIPQNSTNEELQKIYDKWSTTYDADVDTIGYVAHSTSANFLSAQMKELGFQLDAPILDMGSGTGLVGEALHKLGHSAIDALDLSQKCLEVAGEKGAYRNLIRGVMASHQCSELGVEANQYAASICIGVFTMGHVKAAGFDDLVHVTKPGGLVCFTIRNDVQHDPKYGYDEKIEKLSREKKWRLIQKVHDDTYKTGLGAMMYVYQILEK